MTFANPPQTPQEQAHLGLNQLRSGNSLAARQNLEAAIQRGFTHPDVWVALGQACVGMSEHENALKAYDTALQSAPNHLRALLGKGEALQHMGQLNKAASFYKGALAVAPPPDDVPQDLRPVFMKAFKLIEEQTALYEKSLMAHLPKDTELAKMPPRFASSMEILFGRAKPYYQKPTRYHYPDLPQKPIYGRDEFDWVATLENNTAEIRKELASVLMDQQNLSPYIQATGSDLVIRKNNLINNSDWSACYLWKNGELQADMAEKCPKTVEILKSLPMDFLSKQAPSVLFSVLKPGTHIPPHHGMLNTRLICHLPLIVPDSCGIRVGNHKHEWREGEMFIFDDSVEHEAWNKSSETRVILIFEIWRPEIEAAERVLIEKTFDAIAEFDAQS